MLETLHEAAKTVAERAEASIVRVGRGRRSGCGIYLGGGRVLTNAHHVGRDGTTVQTLGGRVLDAEVAGVDIDGDLAIVKVPFDGEGVAFSESGVTVGQPILALAAAHRGPRVTVGFVSAVGQAFRGPRGRRISGSIEHTAPMAPGSSGGALLDLDGRLVGLNTRRLGGGFYLALPADAAMRASIERLAAGESVERPRLGIAIAPSWLAQRMRAAVGLPPRDGLLVREVEPDGNAAAAGLLVGDLIVAAAGRPMTDPEELEEAIAAARGSLDVKLVRGEEEMDVTIALA
jgi:serine protease Do